MAVELAFTHFPTLTTARLDLRQVQEADAVGLFAIKSNSDVTSRYGQEPHRSFADTLAWILRIQADYPRRETLFWVMALKKDPQVIGACTLWNIDPTLHCAEIGYELHPDYWGRGFMKEALSAVLSFGFRDLGLHRIEANPLAENKASIDLLQKLGFTLEGKLRQRIYFRGRFLDQCYYGLLQEEWRKTA